MQNIPEAGVERSFPATMEGMVAARDFLDEFYPAPTPAIIMDEVVSNIVRCSGATGFAFHLLPCADGVELVFSDDGREFDPLTQVAEPDVTAPAEARGIGGLGMFMVKQLAQAVAYRRENGRNILTVKV